MLPRILIAIGLLGLLNAYAASHIILRLPLQGVSIAVAWALASAFFLLQLAGPFGDRLIFPRLRQVRAMDSAVHWLGWSSYLSFGIMSILVFYGITLDILQFLSRVFSLTTLSALDREILFALVTLTSGTIALGLQQASAGPTVRQVEVPIRNLPQSFDGFQIAQISDLHVGRLIRHAYVGKVVGLVNALKPDLIAMTGDMADGKPEDLVEDLAPLATLRATHGVFYVPGNHEYYWGPVEGWLNQFGSLGAVALCNRHEILRRGDDALVIAGIPDFAALALGGSPGPDPKKALEGAPPSAPRILLAHQPRSYSLAHEAGFDLQLSGHTHSGQYFPFSLLIRFFHRYFRGLNRHGNMWIQVNPGTGFWGPPLRAGVPAEITLLTLRTEPDLQAVSIAHTI